MTQPLFQPDSLDEAFTALRQDILGGHISTIRNYNFAILPYLPAQEFKLRLMMRRLTEELRGEGWGVLPISLQKLLLDRIRATGEENVASLISREQRLHAKDPDRALNDLRDRIARYIEGVEGIAADVAKLIDTFAAENQDRLDSTLVLIGRAGALYPFFRSSALLKHIDGKTKNIPVVLLYPGVRKDRTALSFMGELDADRDYRPRIYP